LTPYWKYLYICTANQLKRQNDKTMENTIEINAKHFEAGKRDHENGYYDKWYRHNTKNDGYSYEMGWRSVQNDKDIQIIECN
jgi:hypothetical protein